MSKNEQVPSGDPSGWLDFKDPKKVAIGLGAAVAALGVGVYAAKNGKKLFVAYGDRRMREKGWVSLGELEEGGAAVSVADRAEAIDAEDVGRNWFAMGGDEGFAYPQEGDEAKYLATARKLYGLIKDHLPPFAGGTGAEDSVEKQ